MTRGAVHLTSADDQTGTFCFDYAFQEKAPKPPANRSGMTYSGCAVVRRVDSWLTRLDVKMSGETMERGITGEISSLGSVQPTY